MENRRGVALIYTLAVGVLLIILASSLLFLYITDYRAQKQQQAAIQAYFNARSGVESYAITRIPPPSGAYDFGRQGSCQVRALGKDLIFEGIAGGQHRPILLLEGDPARRQEQP